MWVFPLTATATVMSGLFGGVALQKLMVELPARNRVGAIAFAKYARASDLGNGLYVYPAFAIVGELVTLGAFVMAFKTDAPPIATVLLGLASAAGLGVLVTT